MKQRTKHTAASILFCSAYLPGLCLPVSAEETVQEPETVLQEELTDPEKVQDPALEDTEGLFNTWYQQGNDWFYYLEDGSLAKGWMQQNGNWFYLDETTGIRQKGLCYIHGNLFYLAENGCMQTGMVDIPDNGRHFFREDGLEKRGWVQYEGSWYYFSPENGVMGSGLIQIPSGVYYLDPENGNRMVCGMQYVPETDGVCYFTQDGARKTGWVRHQNAWYYFSPETGIRVSGEVQIGSDVYMLDLHSNGKMVTGWCRTDRGWKYYRTDGARKSGFLVLQDQVFYLDPQSGVMQSGSFTIGRTTYKTDSSGAIIAVSWPAPGYLMQTDSRWRSRLFHGIELGASGCLPSSMAMAINTMKGTSFTPLDMAVLIDQAGMLNTKGLGAGGEAIVYLAEYYGIPVRPAWSAADMKTALKQGKIVIACMNPGTFDEYPGTTHCIFVYGFSQGKANVLDPAFIPHNGSYPLETIWRERSTDWLDKTGGGPLFILG